MVVVGFPVARQLKILEVASYWGHLHRIQDICVLCEKILKGIMNGRGEKLAAGCGLLAPPSCRGFSGPNLPQPQPA